MKAKLSVATAIGVALISLCVSAQENDRSMNFRDHLGQIISIDKAGTVGSFTDSKGQKVAAKNSFNICPCGGGKCIASTDLATTKSRAELHVDFPIQGAVLKEGETLIVTATVESPAMTVTRKLSWLSGSSVVSIDETVITSKATKFCSFSEGGKGLLKGDPCPDPPGTAKCPAGLRMTAGEIKSSKRFQIEPIVPLHVRFGFDLSQLR